jgi:hypothetical protein
MKLHHLAVEALRNFVNEKEKEEAAAESRGKLFIILQDET